MKQHGDSCITHLIFSICSVQYQWWLNMLTSACFNKNIIKKSKFYYSSCPSGGVAYSECSCYQFSYCQMQCELKSVCVNLSIRRAATGVSWSRSCARPRSAQVWGPHNPNSNPAAAAAEAVLATTLASLPISVMRCSWPMQLQAPPHKFKAKALFYWTKQRCMLRL